MVAAPGAPDILTLSIFAYQVFETYKGAPKRFQGLCEDIGCLEIVLRRLGKSLTLYKSESIADALPDVTIDLERLVNRTGRLLEDLQQKQGSAYAPRGLNRFKWSQTTVNSIRSEITSTCGIITAFNTSLTLGSSRAAFPPNDTQKLIGERRDNVSLDAHSRSETSSVTIVEDPDGATNKPIESQSSEPSASLLLDHTASEAQLSHDREMVRKRVTTGDNGLGQEHLESSSAMAISQRGKEDIEVLCAVYGRGTVTDTMQRLFRTHIDMKLSRVSCTITNETFGDSHPGAMKAFCMVWRKVYHLDYGTLYSAPQKVFAREGQTVVIDIGAPLPNHESSNEKPGAVHILAAGWHDLDVTNKAATLAQINQEPSIFATNEEFGNDPAIGFSKVLSVIFTYSGAAAALSFCSSLTASENQTVEIPPFLDIKIANFGGLDITDLMRAKISSRQTLTIDTNNILRIAPSDPWPSVQKSVLVLYQYSTYPMQLLVVGEGSGIVSIAPDGPLRRKFFFEGKNGPGPNISVLTVVWGIQPVSEDRFVKDVLSNGQNKVHCNNIFFGRDGWGYRPKTCMILLQNTLTGEIICVSGREGSTFALPTVWPAEE